MAAATPALARARVRLARSDDLAEIDGLLARSYPVLLKPDYPPSVLVGAVPLISRAQPALLGSGRYFVVEDEAGKVKAAGGWSATAPGSGRVREDTAHVRHVVTDPAATRRGYGRRILDRVLDEAAAAGAATIECLSTRTARPFYLALGFTVLEAVQVPLRPGIAFPAIRMRRSL